jgi:protein SCO1/2
VWIRTGTPHRVQIDFSQLTNEHGAAGNTAGFAGHYLLVAFGYTSCPDVCPLTLVSVHAALQRIPDATALVPIFITVDPKRDTWQRLGTYVQSFDPRIRAFTGSEAAIARAAAAFHVEYRAQSLPGESTYTVDHTARLFLLDPQHNVVATLPENISSHDLADRIVRAFNEARRG